MRRRIFEWLPRWQAIGERSIAGVWLAIFLVAVANYLAGWRLLGNYDNSGALVVTLIGLVLMARVFFQGLKHP